MPVKASSAVKAVKFKHRTKAEIYKYLDDIIGVKIDFDKAFMYQCQDVAVAYCYWLTYGVFRLNGNARDSINPLKNKLPNAYFTVHENTPNFMPKKGDIIVYTIGWADNEYGHIGIVYGDVTLQSCVVIEQNWDGEADTGVKKRIENGYDGVSHFIRPKVIL